MSSKVGRYFWRHELLAIFMLLSPVINAQEIHVHGAFTADSIKIGEPIAYGLSVRYPKHLTALLPDSTFAFLPFELNRKIFFPTETRQGISFDSAVYYLSTFEIDKIQSLSLPVFIAHARDCTVFQATPDSVYLVELVSIPHADSTQAQNLPLKTNTLYERVFTQFNYIILLIIAGVLIVTALVTWAIFGKRIIRYVRVRSLQRGHQRFIQAYTEKTNQLNITFSPESAEQTLSIWKKYMEQLEQLPYTKLTTRETVQLVQDEQLRTNLQTVDKAIYGHPMAISEPLQGLQQFAEQHFQKKLSDLKHG